MFDACPAADYDRVDDAEPPSPTQRLPSIRHAIVSDCSQLMALEQRVFSSARFSARQWRSHLDSDSAVVLVARKDRRMVGSVLLFFRRGSPVARIASLAVDPQLRCRGVATALLAAAEQMFDKRGVQRVRVEVSSDNSAALKLCQVEGYRADQTRAGHYEKVLR